MAFLTRDVVRRAGAAWAAAGLAAALVTGCSSRERANPLDPANPNTAGRPAGFAAIALSGQVLLTWDPTGALSTQIFRRAEGEADFTALSPTLAPAQTLFTDTHAPDDVTYHYRLYFVTSRGLSGLPASADATPSRVIAWTADANRGSLIRLSADGREIAGEQPAFGQPAHLAVDRDRDLVWVTDFDGGRVVVYNPSFGSRVAVPGFVSPNVVAIDPADGSGWITDYDNDVARHVLPSGSPGTPSSIGGLDHPLGIDVDPRSHEVWVCERGANRVRRFRSDGVENGSVSVTSPSRVAVDSANGGAWITSFEGHQLVHVDAAMIVRHTLTTFRGPVGVAVDPRAGRIWVADPVAAQVAEFDRNGNELVRVSGLTDARDLTVERASGEAWVAMRGTVARISPGGAVLTTTRGLSAPVAVALDRLGP